MTLNIAKNMSSLVQSIYTEDMCTKLSTYAPSSPPHKSSFPILPLWPPKRPVHVDPLLSTHRQKHVANKRFHQCDHQLSRPNKLSPQVFLLKPYNLRTYSAPARFQLRVLPRCRPRHLDPLAPATPTTNKPLASGMTPLDWKIRHKSQGVGKQHKHPKLTILFALHSLHFWSLNRDPG